MSRFVDRRLNGKNKSAVNRRRFIRRNRQQIKKAVDSAISGRSIQDIGNGEKIIIPKKDVSEPNFGYDYGGVQDRVLPGNKEFHKGDQIKRPPPGGGKGGGNEASADGEGLDEFIFEISREEFLDFFFEDLELPDLVRKELAVVDEEKFVRAGFTTAGVPTNLHVVRSMRGAMQRRIAIGGKYKRRLNEIEQQLRELEADHPSSDLIPDLLEEMHFLKARIASIPYVDEFDLRYRNRVSVPMPSTQAVMICLMDVSGSMTQDKKDLAKRFFMLLYLFLNRNYEKIQLVFIRHHTQAKEVDEQDFFYSRETGGTVVSTALRLAHETIAERYPPSKWNIYIAQASDGDNWDDDSPRCSEILINQLMPACQYYAYIEIGEHSHVGTLWREYIKVDQAFTHFAMQRIEAASDIYPVFRALFKKKGVAA